MAYGCLYVCVHMETYLCMCAIMHVQCICLHKAFVYTTLYSAVRMLMVSNYVM